MALRLLLWVCAAGLPPQELLVLQQLGSEACGSRAVQCEDGHVTPLGPCAMAFGASGS